MMEEIFSLNRSCHNWFRVKVTNSRVLIYHHQIRKIMCRCWYQCWMRRINILRCYTGKWINWMKSYSIFNRIDHTKRANIRSKSWVKKWCKNNRINWPPIKVSINSKEQRVPSRSILTNQMVVCLAHMLMTSTCKSSKTWKRSLTKSYTTSTKWNLRTSKPSTSYQTVRIRRITMIIPYLNIHHSMRMHRNQQLNTSIMTQAHHLTR